MTNVLHDLNDLEIKIVHELLNKGDRSFADVAKAVGISERGLYRYRQKKHIKEAVRHLAIQELEEDVPVMIKALKKNIQKGDYRSIELGFKALGILVDRKEVTQTTTIKDDRYQDLSEDEIDDELDEINRQLRLIEGGA